ncbi:MAG: hypothetical protein AB1714_05335 [Acidobacteriota bacterium]
MKRIWIFVGLAATALAHGSEVVSEVSWSKLKASDQLLAGEVVVPDTGAVRECLKITGASGRPVQILSVKAPGISKTVWAINGQIRYEDVEGAGYMEMWSVFPSGSRYFSRTMDVTGPMGQLTGSSGWRPFVLPFFSKEGEPAPAELIVNVVLPGRGTVYVGPLRIAQFLPGESPFEDTSGWWSSQTGGCIGALLGVFGGLAGGLVGWLVGVGKGRQFVLSMMKLMCVVGSLALAAGLFSVIGRQPYHVYYPLLLGGVLYVVLFACTFRTIGRRYAQLELRKMSAMDSR